MGLIAQWGSWSNITTDCLQSIKFYSIFYYKSWWRQTQKVIKLILSLSNKMNSNLQKKNNSKQLLNQTNSSIKSNDIGKNQTLIA